jgi:hypothetical protein
MTKEEKAKELFNKYYSYLKANLMYDEEAIEDAKVCALIAIDEILNLNDIDGEYSFYLEVKQEIEKL